MIFDRRATKDAEKRALELIKNKQSKKTSVTMAVPRSMRDKVELAKKLSLQVFEDKLNRLELLTEPKLIEHYIDKAIKNGIIAVDTETDGLNRVEGKVAGICLYTPKEKGVYIPIEHYSYMTNKLLTTNVDKAFIREQFDKMTKANIKYIFHNAKFDMHQLYWKLDIRLTPYWDTFIGAMLLNENEEHGLKYLYQKYVVGDSEEQQVAKFNTLFKGISFTMIPPNVGYMYAGYDPIMTYELYKFQEPFLDGGIYCKERGLEKVSEVFRNIEMPLLNVVFDMECTGVEIDKELAKELKTRYEQYLIQAEKRFQKEVENINHLISDRLALRQPNKYKKLCPKQLGYIDINISSVQQLAILFYDVLGFISPDNKKPRGTGEAIISTYDHPLVSAIIEYRGMEKLISTYIDAIPAMVSTRDNKLHASFNQVGTVTGRFSSNEPNLQNIPSRKKQFSDGTVIDAGHDIRQMFIAGTGNVIVGGDFSQQEPRCLAHLSGDEFMQQAYREGKDLYATLASQIYAVPYDECKEFRPDGTVNPEGKTRRQSVKEILLGIMYGRGVNSIAEKLHITTEDAQQIINNFYDSFPKVREFVTFTQEFARDYGYVQTIWGRKRRLPDMQLDPIDIRIAPRFLEPGQCDDVDDATYYKYLRLMQRAYGKVAKEQVIQLAQSDGYLITDNSGKIASAERQCVNSVVQGSSADMTKIAMLQIYNNARLKELNYKLIIPVHDEVLGVCPQENAKEVALILEEIMTNVVSDIFSIPMKCDIEVTRRWYGESVEL